MILLVYEGESKGETNVEEIIRVIKQKHQGTLVGIIGSNNVQEPRQLTTELCSYLGKLLADINGKLIIFPLFTGYESKFSQEFNL